MKQNLGPSHACEFPAVTMQSQRFVWTLLLAVGIGSFSAWALSDTCAQAKLSSAPLQRFPQLYLRGGYDNDNYGGGGGDGYGGGGYRG
jgi:hypothetical protein